MEAGNSDSLHSHGLIIPRNNAPVLVLLVEQMTCRQCVNTMGLAKLQFLLLKRLFVKTCLSFCLDGNFRFGLKRYFFGRADFLWGSSFKYVGAGRQRLLIVFSTLDVALLWR